MLDGARITKRIALTNFKSAVRGLKQEVTLDRNSYDGAKENSYALKIERMLIETVRCLEKLTDYLEADE